MLQRTTTYHVVDDYNDGAMPAVELLCHGNKEHNEETIHRSRIKEKLHSVGREKSGQKMKPWCNQSNGRCLVSSLVVSPLFSVIAGMDRWTLACYDHDDEAKHSTRMKK